MRHILSSRMLCFIVVGFALLACGVRAQATDISGTISSTLTISEDSQLVGDVTCTVAGAPCIKFGASGITLSLNGFTITGRADPPAGCIAIANFSSAVEDGIEVVGQHDVAIFGPGLVHKFARQGITVSGATKVKIKGVTAADNCFSGIFLTSNTTDSDIEKNVLARNAIASNGAACGGT